MFDWKVKDIKATNAIILGDKTEEEGRPFKARFLQAGLVKYNFGVCLLKKETIDRFVNTFMECPVIIGHKDDIDKNDVKGTIKNIWFSPEDGWFWCSGIIDDEAAKKVEKGFNVSCQYRITEYTNNDGDKLHNGNRYDKEILNGVFEHLAIVENPRYEDAYIAVNAIMATNEDQWITIGADDETGRKGKHILVKEGQTKEEAIKEKFQEWASKDKKQGKLFDTDKYHYKDYYSKQKEEKQKQYDEIEKKHQDNLKKQSEQREEKKNKAIQDYIDGKITPEELEKIVPDMPFFEWLNLADKRTEKQTETKKEEKSIIDTISERDKQAKELKENGTLKDIKTQKSFEEQQQEDLNKGELVNLTEDHYNRISEDELKKEFQEVQKEFAKWKDKKNFPEYKNYRNKLLKIKDIYEKRFGQTKTGKKEGETASNSFLEQFKDMLYTTLAEGIVDRLGELRAQNEDKWITIHPHGKSEDGENDYRRLLIKEGETVEDAMHRQGYYDKRKVKDEKKEKETSEEAKKNKRSYKTAI